MENKQTPQASDNQNTQESTIASGNWMNDLESVDRQLEEEDKKNAVYRKRMLYLIPFQFFSLFATIKYFQNIQKIAKKMWPKRQKATVLNFFFVGTAQAILFSTFYIGGSLAILGINPIKFIRENKVLVGGPTSDELSLDEKVIEQQVKGMKMADAFMLRTFKAMGLSEKTMIAIEKDLREQQQAALEQKNTKKQDDSNK